MKPKIFILILLCSNTVFAKKITITMVGDIGFNKNSQAPLANYVEAYGRKTRWDNLTSEIYPYIDSDINFGNLETVISNEALTSANEKAYKFQSHPNAVGHLISNIGFNLFSAANNHAADYGRLGLESTYQWLNYFSSNSQFAYHGIGTTQEIIKPRLFKTKGQTVAFLAIGIDRFGLKVAPPTSNQIGSLNYYSQKHVSLALQNLKKAKADFKIISVHYGTEGETRLDLNQKNTFHNFIDISGADLIIGHHPHVVRPVEIYKGKLIAYSLGNFLLIGAANMDINSIGKSYGLILKAEVNITNQGNQFTKVSAIPIQGMHYSPFALETKAATLRLDFLNMLSLTELGDNAVVFKMQGNQGVWAP